MCFQLYRSSDTRWIAARHTAAVIAESGGNGTCKCHLWLYMICLVCTYVVNISDMLFWINRHTIMMIWGIVIKQLLY